MKEIIKKLLAIAVVPITILLLFRICYVCSFVSLHNIVEYWSSIPLLIFNSMRFDLQVTAYLLLLPTLALGAALYMPVRKWAFAICRIYITVVGVLLIVLGIIDWGFYLNFNNHINITLFDFFNEGPWGLIVCIWQDYPVLWLLLAIAVATIAVWYFSGKIFAEKHPEMKWKGGRDFLMLFVFIAFFVVSMRGSLSEFPLQIENTVISDNRRFNDIIPNAPFMLKKAVSDKSKAFEMKSTACLLKEYGFSNIREAMSVLGEYRLTGDTLTSIRKVLFAKASATLPKRQPNVVIALCESWSNFLLTLDDCKGSISCGMKKHMNEDILFRRYQSVFNATIGSIESLTVASPFERLFASRYRYMKLPTSIAIPFAGSGYDCRFLTGMDVAWENVNEALINEGFKEVVGKYELLREHPEYKANTIGVYDQFLLHALLKQLNKPCNRPQMILMMTTTNHPPFDLPKGVKLPDLPDSFYSKECFENEKKSVIKKYIRAYQYFNKSMAAFLDDFKKSPAAKNTILIVTGDHNVRAILNYNVVGNQWQNSVPLYIYLPPYLRNTAYPKVADKYGCHYDILPTVAPFAFKGVEYLRMGENLLSSHVGLANSYSYNDRQILAESSFKAKATRIANARNLLLKLYFQFILKTKS